MRKLKKKPTVFDYKKFAIFFLLNKLISIQVLIATLKIPLSANEFGATKDNILSLKKLNYYLNC